MDVKTLIEELQKLPPSTQYQGVQVNRGNWTEDVTAVTWQGNHVELETD